MEKISANAVKATVKDVCEKYFDFDFDKLEVPVKINGRLSSTLGRVIYNTRGSKYVPKSIEFSKELVSGHYKMATVESVIKHEVCHLVLMVRGEEFGDGTKNFEDTVKKIGGTSTGTIKNVYEYYAKCSCCGRRCLTSGKESSLKRYIDNGYVSKCCNSPVILDGQGIGEDTTTFTNADAGEILRSNIQNKKAKKVNKTNNKPAEKPAEKPNNDGMTIDPETHLIAPKTGKLKVNQTALWRTLTYYVDQQNDDEIKFLYKNFKDEFVKGYKCLTKNRIKYIDMIMKVEA